MLAAAARATASNILRLVGDRTEAVLVQRGDHALWDALAARLARAGHDVRRVEKPDDAQRWDLTEHVPAGDRGYLVYHDPFRGDGEVPAGLDALRHAEPAPTVVVAFPHDLSAETLAAVSGHFLRALAEPWYATEFRARSLRSLIGAHGSVWSTVPASRCARPWRTCGRTMCPPSATTRSSSSPWGSAG